MNFHQAFEAFKEEISDWLNSIVIGMPNFVAAIFALIMFLLIARIVKFSLMKVLGRISHSESVNRLTANTSAFVFVLAGIIVALGILKIDTAVTSLLTGAGIIGLGISFAFQDVIANTFSGIILAFQRPFQPGDYIESNDVYGIVSKIGLRQIELTDLDGQHIWIPARKVLQSVLKNYSTPRMRRIVIQTGISYGDNLRKVKKVTLDAVNKVENLLPSKPVDFFFTDFGESAINFQVYFWVDFARETDYLKAVNDAIIYIKDGYDENDITITFPIRTLDFGIKGGKDLTEMMNTIDNNKSGQKNGNDE